MGARKASQPGEPGCLSLPSAGVFYNLRPECKKLLKPDFDILEAVLDQGSGNQWSVFQRHRFDLHDCLLVLNFSDRRLFDPRHPDRSSLARSREDLQVGVLRRVVGCTHRTRWIHVDVHGLGLDNRVRRLKVQDRQELDVFEVRPENVRGPNLERIAQTNFERVAHRKAP